MNRRLIIVSSNTLVFYLIEEDKEVVELHVDKRHTNINAGDIYKGKVKRIVPAMNAVFIDIGEEKEAFLPIKDPSREKYNQGQPVMVQVKRTPIGVKGSKVSTNVAIPGKYLVLTPNNSKVSISNKYSTQEEKTALKERISNILEPYNQEQFGYIIRTLACEASDDELIEDFMTLKYIWGKIQETFNKRKAPSKIYTEEYKLFSIMRDYAGNFDEIIVDDIEIFNEIKVHLKENYANKHIKLVFYEDKQPIEEKFQLERIISRILSPYVWLKSGGYLVVEETEALVVIDVNSGKNCKNKNLEETAFDINKEAIPHIVKTLRLKNLGGIVVIDFIDMKDSTKKEQIIKLLEEEFTKDKRPVKIKGFTSLGLLELTRKKLEESLIKQLSQDCFYCKKKGYVKSVSLILWEIERAINKNKPFAYLKITINPLLKEHIEKLLKSMGLLKNVKILTNDKLHIEKFIIERE